jgi:hypothetical protein
MLGNLIRETANGPGTGTTVTLIGATAGRRTFVQEIGAGNQCYYMISDGTQHELQQGTVSLGPPATLTRGVPIWTSAAGTTSPTRLNFTASCVIYGTLPASKHVIADVSGSVNLPGSLGVPSSITQRTTGLGYTSLVAGTGTSAGTVEFRTQEGTLRGYVGFADGTNIVLAGQNGWGIKLTGAVSTSSTLSVSGYTTLSGGLSVSAGGAVVTGGITAATGDLYVNAGQAVLAGDVTTYRAAATTTGYVFLGTANGTRYVGYDGNAYVMPNAALWVNGAPVITTNFGVGVVGQYAVASTVYGGDYAAGTVLAGTNLRDGYDAALTGTWRCLSAVRWTDTSGRLWGLVQRTA